MEHEEFKKLLSALRAGNTPLNRKQVCGVLLDKIFEENIINCSNVSNGQTVCMTLDGWTNIVNKLVICVTVTTNPGEVYFIESIDTSGHSHTTKYLIEIANQAIIKCKTQYNCFVVIIIINNF